MNKCPICDGTRILPGPNYEPGYMKCQDCGYSVGSPEPEVIVPDPSQFPSVPDGGFATPEEAQKYLMALQNATTKVKPKREVKVKVPLVETSPSLPPEYVWQVIHMYTRTGSSWQQTMSQAKSGKEGRGDSVLMIAHNHIYNDPCDHLCREI